VKRVILLADDSPTIQRLVSQTFAGGEYDVICVSNGDAAIKRFEELRPDLVLADIYMPGKNGYEVCALVKKHPVLGGTPVVLLAGAFDAYDEETASQVGAATHITKPFEPQALVNLVVSLLPKGSTRSRAPVAPAVPRETAPAPHPQQTAPPVASAQPHKPLASVALHRGEVAETDADLLGLNDLFQPHVEAAHNGSVSDEEIERIADRVIQKLSTQVIESVAWEVVPEITAKVLREELKRQS
jgi:CheY-like chemotaxis protein